MLVAETDDVMENCSMQAWVISEIGRQPELTMAPMPVPGQGEALVRVVAVGLNFADLLMQDGTYQQRPRLPFIPGMEVSGVVVALGPDTIGPAPGTPVMAVCGHGGLAEALCLPVNRLVTLPDGMGHEEAAGFPIAFGTAYLALTLKAGLQPEETLLVTGAAGGVGLAAVEVGKRLGARVIATARGDDRLAVAKAAGADHLISSEADNLKDQLRALGGVDVVFDTVGGAGFDAALRACRPDGRILAIGFASGQVPQVPANLLLVKNLTVSGFWFGGYMDQRPQAVADSLGTLLRWRAEGALRPATPQVLPFDAFPGGLQLLRTRQGTGKLVVRVQDP
jgi:NADPH:quinone reductase